MEMLSLNFSSHKTLLFRSSRWEKIAVLKSFLFFLFLFYDGKIFIATKRKQKETTQKKTQTNQKKKQQENSERKGNRKKQPKKKLKTNQKKQQENSEKINQNIFKQTLPL